MRIKYNIFKSPHIQTTKSYTCIIDMRNCQLVSYCIVMLAIESNPSSWSWLKRGISLVAEFVFYHNLKVFERIIKPIVIITVRLAWCQKLDVFNKEISIFHFCFERRSFRRSCAETGIEYRIIKPFFLKSPVLNKSNYILRSQIVSIVNITCNWI